MDNLFKSIFDSSISVGSFILVVFVALILGFVVSLVSKHKSESTKSFFITTSLLPVCISMIIMLVNGNLGAGVAVAGAFSLIRFRSATGTAKEIATIFIGMAIGLALGMGYVGYAVLFTIIVMIVFFILNNTNILDENKDSKEMKLKIMVPEQLDYEKAFSKIFDEFLEKYELIKVKTVLMGSAFNLQYNVTFKNVKEEKAFIDEIRTKNSNLEVLLERHSNEEKDL